MPTELEDFIRKSLVYHIQSARSRRCVCGWRPEWPDSRIGAEYIQHRDHLAKEIANGLMDAGLIKDA